MRRAALVCPRCDQEFRPGQPAPWCVGGRYNCDPSTAIRVAVEEPIREPIRIQVIPITKTTLVEAGGVEPDEDDRVAVLRQWARELGRMPGRDAVKAKFGVGSGTANLLREAAEKPTMRAVS